MASNQNNSQIKTRLTQIADLLVSKAGSYSTDDVFNEFEKQINDLSEAEKLSLIRVGARVLTGRIGIAKANISWNSPHFDGLGLNKTVSLMTLGKNGKHILRKYPVERVTPRMVKAHEEFIKTKGEKNTKREAICGKVKRIAELMLEDGCDEDTPLLNYRGS